MTGDFSMTQATAWWQETGVCWTENAPSFAFKRKRKGWFNFRRSDKATSSLISMSQSFYQKCDFLESFVSKLSFLFNNEFPLMWNFLSWKWWPKCFLTQFRNFLQRPKSITRPELCWQGRSICQDRRRILLDWVMESQAPIPGILSCMCFMSDF